MDLTLPYVSLQADYSQAYTDVEQSLHDFEKVWLSAYCQNAPDASIHTKLLLSSTRTREVEVEVDPAGSSDTLIRIEAMPAFGVSPMMRLPTHETYIAEIPGSFHQDGLPNCINFQRCRSLCKDETDQDSFRTHHDAYTKTCDRPCCQGSHGCYSIRLGR